MTNKKKIIIVAAIVIIAVGALAFSFLKPGKKNTQVQPTEGTKTEENAKTPAPEVIDGADSGSQETKPEAAKTQTGEKPEAQASEAPEETQKAQVSEVITPEYNINIMYLVSNSNPNKDEALKMAQELKKEYETKVYFTIMNIDEDEMGANFALPDETPKLVMFGENNLFEMKNNCADKQELKKIIDAAINNA